MNNLDWLKEKLEPLQKGRAHTSNALFTTKKHKPCSEVIF